MTPEARLAMLNATREDLPEEVRSQLSKVSPRGWLRLQIVSVLTGANMMSPDEIIVSIWKEFKKVVTRKVMLTRLSEMYATGELERVKRGFYRLPKETP